MHDEKGSDIGGAANFLMEFLSDRVESNHDTDMTPVESQEVLVPLRKHLPAKGLEMQLSVAQARRELVARVRERTKNAMGRVYCYGCKEHKQRGEKLFHMCDKEVPVPHLLCQICYSKSRRCEMCEGDHPRWPKEVSPTAHHDFATVACQSCPLCSDDKELTCKQLLEHVQWECAAITSEKVLVDVRILTLLRRRWRTECAQMVRSSLHTPNVALVFRKILEEQVALIVREREKIAVEKYEKLHAKHTELQLRQRANPHDTHHKCPANKKIREQLSRILNLVSENDELRKENEQLKKRLFSSFRSGDADGNGGMAPTTVCEASTGFKRHKWGE
ncbi:hypothetical protein CYMTET_8262 [Cymbomonas tetramitiformis]|uniref:Uncharacterized protein n=1 Tax=Cymbomonas tetramitiformis TaxID=36881 RepID=A0AAE0GV91_9CHLO|nr:hypothetical protein CYMTET_8262 [Cymbomonas tetramitiformis]